MQDIIDIDAEFLLSSMDISGITFYPSHKRKINTKSLDFVHSDFVLGLKEGLIK